MNCDRRNDRQCRKVPSVVRRLRPGDVLVAGVATIEWRVRRGQVIVRITDPSGTVRHVKLEDST